VFGRASQEVEDLEEIPSIAPRRPVSDRLGGHRRGGAGPYDVDEPDAERIRGGLDFGSLRVPMPARAQLQIEHGSGELLRAVHVLVPSGRVSLSALAAPRSTPLWRNLADEIAESLANDGARVWAVGAFCAGVQKGNTASSALRFEQCERGLAAFERRGLQPGGFFRCTFP